MIRAVRATREELIATYGITERLAVRVLALASKGLGVTAAALQEAARIPAVADAFLAPELLEKAADLDTARLRKLGPGGKSLAISGAILCLAEELQAEDAPSGEARLPAASRTGLAPATGGLDAQELRHMFPVEEVARLKLVLLTSVDAASKVEALRRMAISPLPDEEKGIMAIRAIADPSPDVRREATLVLEKMGLDAELADALKSSSTGTARQKEVALRRIALLGRKAGPAEQAVALAALVSALEFEKEPGLLKEILAALSAFAAPVAARAEIASSLARHLVRVLAESFAALSSQARILLDDLAATRTPQLAATLWREAESSGDRRLRTFFIESLFAHPLPKELDRSLCRLAARDLADRALEDLESRRLADALRLRGAVALEALLETLADVKEESRFPLVPVLDTVAIGPDIPARLRNRAAEFLLQSLRDGNRSLRTTIIEARLPAHEDLDPGLKRRLAVEFMANLHAYKAQRIHDLTAGAIQRLGLAAEEALVGAIRKSPHEDERNAAAGWLAEIAGDEQEDADAVSRIAKFLRAQEEEGRLPAGLAVRSAARAAHGPAAPKELVSALLVATGARAGTAEADVDWVAAMGWLASSPSADPARAADTALRFMDVLDHPMPDVSMRESQGDDGVLLSLGAQTSVYTELIPELLGGLRRLLDSGRLAPGVRRKIAGRLAERYAAVTEYREVWAPGNVGELGELMGAAAIVPGTDAPTRKLLVEALRGNLRNLGTVQVLAGVFHALPGDDADLLASLDGYVADVLSFLGRPEYRERDDQRILIESLGRVAGVPRLAVDKKESDRRRERIVDLLLENAGAFPAVRPLLRALGESDNLPKALRSRAKEGGS